MSIQWGRRRGPFFVPKSYAETMTVHSSAIDAKYFGEILLNFHYAYRFCIRLHVDCGLASSVASPLTLLCLPARSTRDL
jgi:hypothetical protein